MPTAEPVWRLISHAVEALADLCLPRLCCGCGNRMLERGRVLCVPCERDITPLTRPVCPSCGQANADYADDGRCPECPPGELWFRSVRASVVFDGVAAVVVKRLKYSGREEFAPFMAGYMLSTLAEEFCGQSFDLVIPVPLHRSRQGDRGFNQSALLAGEIAEATGVRWDALALRRVRPTSSQTRLPRERRAENIRGAFAVADMHRVSGQRILLVDDVCTTGATLNECARVLRAAGADSVTCLTFARTPRL